jgi:DNA-binding CsgD family transcriptional regulator
MHTTLWCDAVQVIGLGVPAGRQIGGQRPVDESGHDHGLCLAGVPLQREWHELSPDGEPDYPNEPAYLVLARVLLAHDDPGLALSLTDRELEVLRLLAAGRSNQRIAHDLVVALDTVKKHVTHILGKLGAANRTEAVARARPGHGPLTHRTSAGPVAPSGKGIVAPRHSTRQAPFSDALRRP